MNRFIILLGSLALITPVMGAEPVDKAMCEGMASEHQGLVAAGLKADMEKGAEWGKANLSAERLKLISRLIEVEEVLAFRCRTLAIPIKRRELPTGVDPLAVGDLDPAPGAPAGTVKVTKPKVKKPVAAAPQATGDASPPADTVTGSTAAAQPEAKKPNVVRLKTKPPVTKRKPQAPAEAEKPGLFILN